MRPFLLYFFPFFTEYIILHLGRSQCAFGFVQIFLHLFARVLGNAAFAVIAKAVCKPRQQGYAQQAFQGGIEPHTRAAAFCSLHDFFAVEKEKRRIIERQGVSVEIFVQFG